MAEQCVAEVIDRSQTLLCGYYLSSVLVYVYFYILMCITIMIIDFMLPCCALTFDLVSKFSRNVKDIATIFKLELFPKFSWYPSRVS